MFVAASSGRPEFFRFRKDNGAAFIVADCVDVTARWCICMSDDSVSLRAPGCYARKGPSWGSRDDDKHEALEYPQFDR